MTAIDLSNVMRPARRRRLSRLPHLVRRAMSLLWAAAPREFSTAAGLQIVAGLSVAVQLLAGRELLEVLTSGDATASQVAVWLAVVTVATTVVAFAEVGRAEQQRLLAELVGLHATDRVLKAATAAPLVAFDQAGFHDKLERARLNAVLRPIHVANGVIGLVSAGCAIAGAVVALFILEPALIAVVLVALIPTGIAGSRASRALHAFSAAQTERDRRRAYLLATATSRAEAHEVRAFGLGPFLRAQHTKLYRTRIAALRRLIRRRVALGFVGAASTSLLTATTVAALAWLVVTGRASVAAAGAAAAGVVVLAQRLRALAGAAAALYEGTLFLEDFTSFVDSPAHPADARRISTTLPANVEVVEGSNRQPAPTQFTHLTARDLWFTYPASEAPVLRGVSIDVHANEVVALVGLNGSGKTTLAKVLAGLYRPDQGTIHWDDVDTALCDPVALRNAITVVFQDFARYQLSLRDNIAMGRYERETDETAVAEAALRAGVQPIVDALPPGLEAQLGPHFFGGYDLSLGQWQRVAMARAIFRDAPFLVLDEPTAALDPEAEAALFADVRTLCRAKSVLLISHRFGSVRTADRIYVLRAGRVDACGSHDELMAAGGHYAHLFRTQAMSYGSVVLASEGGVA